MKNIEKYLFISLVIFFSLIPLSVKGESKELRLSLAFYSRPIKNKEWEIIITQNKFQMHIESKMYMNKTFKTKVDYKRFQTLINKLIKLGIWIPQKKHSIVSPYSIEEFYVISIESSNQKNIIRFSSNQRYYNKNSNLYIMAREIKNLCRLMSPDL